MAQYAIFGSCGKSVAATSTTSRQPAIEPTYGTQASTAATSASSQAPGSPSHPKTEAEPRPCRAR